MTTYFEDMDAIHHFTLVLQAHQDLQCHHCNKTGQFVSHGFVYKKQHNGDPRAVGKRILCANRYGRQGCGRTRRLYLADHIPGLSYCASHLFVFIAALMGGLSIARAYQQATARTEPRHAYRWLARLHQRLSGYRSRLTRRPEHSPGFTGRTRGLRLLLPTLQALFDQLGQSPCSAFQLTCQSAFI